MKCGECLMERIKFVNLVDGICPECGTDYNDGLTDDEKAALRQYRLENGRSWKKKLRLAWMSASEPGILQALRNSQRFGPEGLAKLGPSDLD